MYSLLLKKSKTSTRAVIYICQKMFNNKRGRSSKVKVHVFMDVVKGSYEYQKPHSKPYCWCTQSSKHTVEMINIPLFMVFFHLPNHWTGSCFMNKIQNWLESKGNDHPQWQNRGSLQMEMVSQCHLTLTKVPRSKSWMYSLDVAPSQDASGKWRLIVYRDSLLKM